MYTMTKKESTDKSKKDGEKKRSRLSLAPLILLLLLLVVILLLLFRLGGGEFWNSKGGKNAGAGADTAEINSERSADSLRRIADSLRRAGEDALRAADSLRKKAAADSIWKADSALKAEILRKARSPRAADSIWKADSLRRALEAEALRRADSLREALAADSLRRLADSIALAEAAKRLADSLRQDSLRRIADSLASIADSAALRAAACARDTLFPWVYADPSGGLHRKAVSVRLVANKACKVEWGIDGVTDWKVYDGKPIGISKPTTLYYRAIDDCGRTMHIKSKRYEFDMTAPRCPAGTELVKTPGGGEICVDVYEWPNKRGAAPQSYVSLYQAMDSCFSVRKRLCTSDEWTAACGGPERWKYTYGEVYEWNTCAVRDTSAHRSGGKSECRSYYGVFDMSGNLAEWTSTPAPQDKSFNNVMGGFWMSGNQSGCADARYSYYPQNKHNPVGFRCCVDAPPAAGGGR